MIVGTAGHIDHGKSTLVRALTGVDTDRLPEEKQRGISIELGYAFLDVSGRDERIGFIDVPGHERLVHTMIAGATGIDFALLLVAADDGVMPQTREHLAVLSLLGLARGAVAITKIDRVETARVEVVRDQVNALLAGTALADSPVVAVSAQTGAGLDALRSLLFEAARSRPAASTGDAASAGDARFRLAIDRVFSLAGAGTVATGTVHAGRVQVGDELRLVPGDRSLRVRSLHVQNRSATSAPPGTRCAIALAGVEKQQVERGQWLVAPEAALQTLRFDAELRLSPGQSEPLRSGQSVHVHLGSAATTATVAVLDRAVLAPGECGIVQVVLRSPWAAWRGDRVVLRDASATRTIAGGRVLDPLAPARYRRTPQRLAELAALSRPDPADRLAGLIGCAPQGVDLRRHAAAEGRALPPMPPSALQQHEARGDWAVGAAQVDAARQQVLEVLAAFHQREPDALGPDAARLRRLALPRWPEPLWRALLADLQADGHVVQRGACVHRPEHAVRLSASEERIAQKVAPMLAVAGFEGAWARDLARDSAEPEPLMRVTLSRLAQRGELHQVVKDLFYPLATMARLAALARDVAGAHEGSVTAAAYRDATGLGRKRAIQILEHFDRIGLLRRVGDLHRLRVDSDLFRGDDGDPPPEPSRAPRPAAGARQAA